MEDLAKEELEEPVDLEVTKFEVGAGMLAFPGCYSPLVVIIARILETRTLLVDPLETSTAFEVYVLLFFEILHLVGLTKSGKNCVCHLQNGKVN